MTEIKFVVNDVKTGKSYQKALNDDSIIGKKVGETVSGSFLGLPGYELQITGGSDTAGFPMRPEIEGSLRKRILMKKGDIGSRINKKGLILRKTIRGNLISNFTAQVNLKVAKHGTKNIPELWGIEEKKEEPKKKEKEEKKETAKEQKTEAKKEEKKTEAKEENPKIVKKETKKEEKK